MTVNEFNETSLDPKDWEQVRKIGYQMVDDMILKLQHTRESLSWQAIPERSLNTYQSPLPKTPSSIESVFNEFKEHIFPYAKGNTHPRFWSWVEGGGTPLGALADFMASVMNSNTTIGNHSAMYIDYQVIEWCKEIMNYPSTSSGILVSGGSLANITALLVAKNSVDVKIKAEGLYALDKKLTLYCSKETHNCIDKAMQVIGIGYNQLRKIPVNEAFQIDIEKLLKSIQEDKANGYQPFCIVGNAGTVNTGAIDDLDALYEISQQEKMWFHVDGAFGALAKLVPEYTDRLKAIEKADSIAFDLHKWMYINYEVGCVLIKNRELHRQAFTAPGAYLTAHERGLASGPEPIANYGMELSRGFKALKVWMSLKEHGIDRYAKQIAQNIDQARYMGEECAQYPRLELMTAVTLNVTCLRYNPGHLSQSQLNEINKEILMRLQERGIASPSYTVLNGDYMIRAAITNHRTRREDIDITLRSISEIGDEIIKKQGIDR